MPSFEDHDKAGDAAEAVRRFAAAVAGRPTDRIQVRLDGENGMDQLCVAEAALSDIWPPATAKELVWLTRSGAESGARLHLQAFAADGEVLCRASFRLGGAIRGRDDVGSGPG